VSSPEELFSVRDRAVVVTGASSGFGDRFTRVLASNGAKVLAVARRADRLQALADAVPGVVPFVADLSDDATRAEVVDVALDELGAIDVLVNNAGVTSSVPAVDEPIDDFRDAMEVNLVAAFDLARRCAPVMQAAGGGSVVNVASTYGLVAATPLGSASYAASKGALVNLTRHLGCEWAADGVRVNALAPGFFPTEMTSSIEPDTPPHRYVIRNTPMRRFGLDHELDGILLYLASDASTYCTGQVFSIDGGWTAR
jgi:NAD(P)-dependent dehydrogenase (short-subunit alcohol dehydrogenase family)